MRWRKFFRRDEWDAELAAEMEAHLAHEIDLNVARGMSRGRRVLRRSAGSATRRSCAKKSMR